MKKLLNSLKIIIMICLMITLFTACQGKDDVDTHNEDVINNSMSKQNLEDTNSSKESSKKNNNKENNDVYYKTNNTTKSIKVNNLYKDTYYKADLEITLNEVKSGDAAIKFAKDKEIDITSLKDNMTIVAANFSFKYDNVETNDSNGVWVSSWLYPKEAKISGDYRMIGGTSSFDGSLSRQMGGNARLQTGDSRVFTGWVVYPVMKNETNNKVGFYGDFEKSSPEDSEYIWFDLK